MGLFDFLKKKNINNKGYCPAVSVPKEILGECKYMKTDLVELVNSGPCCEKCAKLRKRIYSISGKDKRFPLFPKDYRPGCCLSAYPFIYGVMEPSFKARNIIKYSNRPFIDDRTKAEIKQYADWKAMNEKIEQDEHRKEINRKDYAWIEKNLPDLCPKSMAAYSKMKNANSKNYQIIVEEAAKLGYAIK